MDIKIDMKKLDAIIAKAQPEYEKKLVAKKPNASMMAAGFVSPTAVTLDGTLMTFCGAWPKVRALLNVGLKFAGWFIPASQVALAKAFLTAISEEIMPAICGDDE